MQGKPISDTVKVRVIQLRSENPPVTYQAIADRLGIPRRTAMNIMLQEKRRCEAEGRVVMPACQHCGQETDVVLAGRPVCEQCAIERENAMRRYEKKYGKPDLGKPDKTTPRNGSQFERKQAKAE